MAHEKILIVEDERLIALELETRLERLGYVVCAKAVNAEETLNAVHKCNPDLILMDIRISGESDGIETAKQVQAVAHYPVIYVTAFADSDTLDRAKETLPYGYLSKPVQERDLRVTIEMALHKSKIEKELKKAKKELEQSEHRNRTLVSALPDLIFQITKDGTILDYSTPTVESLLLPPELFLNKKMSEILPEAIYKPAIPAIKKSIENNTIEEFSYVIPVGDHLNSFEARATKLNDNEALVVVRDITQRKLLEDEILSSKQRLEMLITSSSVMLYACEAFGDFDATFISNNIYSNIGYTKEEFLSRGFWAKHIHPDDAPNIFNGLAKLFEHNYHTHEYRFMLKDGTYHWMYDELKLIRDESGDPLEIIGVWLNITDRKNAEAEIRKLNETLETRVTQRTLELQQANDSLKSEMEVRQQAEELFRMLFESVPSAILLVDSKGIITLVNTQAENYFGYSRDELAGNKIEMLVPDKSRINHSSLRLKYTSNPVHRPMGNTENLYGLRKNGTMFFIEVSLNPVTINKEVLILTNIIDITERKQAQEKIKQAQLEAEQANKAKSEFLSRTSHELRTPMNAILGFAQLIKMGELNPTQNKGIDHILKSGKHLLGLINEVLDISKIEAGHTSLTIESIAISPLLKVIKDRIKTQAEENQITLEINPGNNLYINADYQRLKQVLLNLANNAIKYNHAGGSVKIEVHSLQSAVGSPSETGDRRPETEDRRLKTEDRGLKTEDRGLKTEDRGLKTEDRRLKTVRISVTDTGLGISPEDIKKLFNPFERIGAEKTETEGAGLGLAVAKKLVNAMEGSIGVESELGKGSTFWVELPLAENAEEQTLTDSLMNPETEAILKSRSLLYIEDNRSNVELVEQILKDHRASIRLISDKFGNNAVRLATRYKPDIILLNLDLPDIHGSYVLKFLQSNPETKHVPVVILCADMIEKRIETLLKAGAKSYLTKPLDVIQFLQVVDEWVKEKS